VTTPTFARDLAAASGAPWTGGNDIITLENGGLYYPPMLEAIKNARKSVTFETFAFMSSTPAYYFCLAMAERARAGVKVHVILDGVGSRNLGDTCKNILTEAGVELHYYRPYNLLRPRWSNNRTHRKILVVDGNLAYTGGAGFADGWMGHAHTPDHWRDTQYEIRGPAVAQLQHVFIDNWRELTGRQLSGPDYFPLLRPAGPMKAQLTLGAPLEKGDTIAQTYLLAIAAARHSLLIEHAYFIPFPALRKAVADAARRGVRVEIITPGPHIDVPLCRTAARLSYPDLLKAGARIWEFAPTMMHGKLIVIDDHLVIAGSANFDDRSLFLNDENNMHVLDRAFAQEQIAMFERDKARSVEITPADLRAHLFNLPSRAAAHLLSPQL
ncbi:MAG: phosphatidylserine/phosphatidylglycerophosphate/cardiolipin synthase family protein, partial [Verrucomicrobia bacterium]|nr:phosphatidylserine/phosphatidylglycerophosphate/cardiolipin synthase family protein [Verrucomicrobiota bacterium]